MSHLVKLLLPDFFLDIWRHFKIFDSRGLITHCKNVDFLNNYFIYDAFQKVLKTQHQLDLLISTKQGSHMALCRADVIIKKSNMRSVRKRNLT